MWFAMNTINLAEFGQSMKKESHNFAVNSSIHSRSPDV